MTKNYFFSILAVVMVALSLTFGAQAANQHSLARHLSPRIPAATSKKAAAKQLAPKYAPESDWEVLGTGLYHDELMISYGMPAADWKVTVEQNTKKTGWYRFIPYNENSSVAGIMGPDDTYMYINATNPKKVYAEDFTAYGVFLFSNVVEENDWDESEMYATMVEGVITWPPVNTFASYDNGWFYCTGETGVALYLPGSSFKDYSMDLATEHYCTDDNKHELQLTAGDDITSFSHLTIQGNYFVTDDIADMVVAKGESVKVAEGEATITLDLNEQPAGIYTTMIVGCDENGNARCSRQTNFIVPDNDIVWNEIGETTFDEAFYFGVYDDFTYMKLTAKLFEAESTPGLYLIDDPYAGHPELGNYLFACEQHAHNHGIIVDATDPRHVMVRPSSLGVACDGDGAAWSLADFYLEMGLNVDEVDDKGFFGTKTLNDDGTYTIEMPYGSLMIGEKNYYYGEFLDCDAPFSFIVPDTEANLGSVFTDDVTTETYNLQGIRVPADTRGLVIVRQGTKVAKRFR